MSHDQMREYLMETTKHVKFFSDYTIDQQLKSNPVKDWMHHCLVFELNTSAQIGFKKFAPQGVQLITPKQMSGYTLVIASSA